MTIDLDALKAAAEVCTTIATDGSLTSGMEALPAVYCAERILSLPIPGEATNPGEQVVRDAHTEDGSKHCVEPARPGPCVVVPVEPTEKMLAAVLEVVDEIPPYFGLTGNALNEQLWKAIAAMLAAAKEE